jgi:release factor glutamine methyltransferase
MKIASNKIKDIVRFFKDELRALYEAGELDTIIKYSFEEFCDIKSFSLLKHGENTVSESELLRFNFAVKDLKREKPLQYVLGKADFYGLKFIVNENVLIPRPETEELVHLVISDLKTFSDPDASLTILDIGTGSGCIPVTLKNKIPSAEVYAMDVSEGALETARKNAVLNNANVKFFQDDILDPDYLRGAGDYDIILSNPPYIKISEKNEMQRNVLDYEPHLALFVDNDDALLFYRKIAEYAKAKLKPGGMIYFEINAALGPETKLLIEEKGFKNVDLIKDINNKNRILRGRL